MGETVRDRIGQYESTWTFRRRGRPMVVELSKKCNVSVLRLRGVSSSNSKFRIRKHCFLSSSPLFFLVIFILTMVQHFSGAPIQRQRRSSVPASMQFYLLKFGYLPQSGFEIRDQVSERRLKEAVRDLQAFANISVTGELDEDTQRLMRKPRCGVPDILSGQFGSRRRKRFIIQGQKWHNTSLTWSLQKSTGSHRDGDVINELTRALEVWARNTPLRFKQLPRGRADEADIRVIFQRGQHDDGYPFDGKGSILAHAFFPGSGQGGDAHFDDDEIWTVDDAVGKEGTRLFAVAAHEFGHSLGLSHSDVEGSLMYPWYQNFGYEFRLHRDDELGIQHIYGRINKFVPNPYNPGNKPVEPTSKPPRERPSFDDGRPNTCDSSYDAISVIRNELFIFKGPYFWRLNDNQLLKGYPSRIGDMWRQLPQSLTHVDAVYEHNDEIIFFIGKQYWRFGDGITLRPDFPKSLTSLGISPTVERIDGAMIWGHNKKTYLFSGSLYWKLREDDRVFRVEPDYPRDMSIWKGVPYNIDSVFKWKDESTYFFKGKVFWKFDDKHMRVASETPSLSAPFWMGCTSHPLGPTEDEPTSSSSPSCFKPHTITLYYLLNMSLIIINLLSTNKTPC